MAVDEEERMTAKETIKWLKEKLSAMKILKLLMNCYIMFIALFPFLLFFNAVGSIVGIILFVYLWGTQQLEISGKIFFLIPHVVFFGTLHSLFRVEWTDYLLPFYNIKIWSFHDICGAAYTMSVFGLPFLLYCFLHTTGSRYVIMSRVYCFILPVFTVWGAALLMG